MMQPSGAILSALFLVFSLAAYTYCQEPSQQNIDLLRQLLEGNLDLVPNEDLNNEEEEAGLESGYIPLQVPESQGPSYEKRGICPYWGCGRRKRPFRFRTKKLFCNFGGCFNGRKRSLPLKTRFLMQGRK
ncbi:uncharacterized protein LOC134267022 [Saccostrea cucullata]|uniref:uncharacterized protein LOC134267022 n=1 Tax=Saccostrea cuccullata TaxID=36930 RepID=UPI002ED1248F